MIIDFLPIPAAGIATVLLAFLWYHPAVFGTAWMRMTNISPEMAERGKRLMPLMSLFALMASMVVAYVMSYFALAWGVYDWVGAIELAFWCWIGFAAPPLLGSVLWEQKPFKLYLINAGYWFVAFLAVALILLF